ncbi:hypothetical protein AN958_09007 [Leucoagaricus sp. SymC.cos]|nr:hypothetical protein AN958_09007 [Leucoagaricus sp. SymC.cos]
MMELNIKRCLKPWHSSYKHRVLFCPVRHSFPPWMAADLTTTYGAILFGAFFAFALSGAISLQCIVYFKTYPLDGIRTKTLVSTFQRRLLRYVNVF